MSKPDTTPPSVREILIYAIGMAALYDTTAESVQKLTDEATSQIEALILDAQITRLEKLKQYNGAYVGMDGKRVDNMVHHDVINSEIATLKAELKEGK